jgi:hypothetical protein
LKQAKRDYSADRLHQDILDSLNKSILDLPKPTTEQREWMTKNKRKWSNRRIYFIQCETGEIKIGTANKVRERLAIFQIGCPFKLKLLKSMRVKDCGLTEKDLFRRFKKYRKRGEWFYPAEEILKFIEMS